MRIVVTGGSGKAGRWVVRDLRDHGHDVLNVDTRHDGSEFGLCLIADLTDYGQAAEALAGADAVVHLAAIPAPRLRPAAETFRINALSTYNVFAAAEANGLRRVVWASSETVLGLPFDTPPAFAPIDETIEPRPETSYALSKLVGETMAVQLNRRTGHPGRGLEDLEHHGARRLRRLPVVLGRRDAPQVEPVGLRRLPRTSPRPAGSGSTADVDGAEVCIVAADDTVDDPPERRPHGRGLPARPADPRGPRPRDAARDRPARRLLGYAPAHHWSDHVAAP